MKFILEGKTDKNSWRFISEYTILTIFSLVIHAFRLKKVGYTVRVRMVI